LDDDGIATAADAGLDETGPLPRHGELEAVGFEQGTIGPPGRVERLLGIVEEIQISRDSRPPQDLIERRSACGSRLGAGRRRVGRG